MKKDPPAENRQRYLFGPVASRRLGRSLGVDLVPSKLCSFDCVYCEAGGTTRLTLERGEHVPVDGVLRELDAFLRDDPALDTVTFSGAGEPTLHNGIGRVIAFLKQRYPRCRLALLTNATLFPDAAVRAELRALDLVIPSLDAADDAMMARINRPAPGLSVAAIIDGLAAFRRESAAAMWLEIFIVPGINDDPGHLQRLRQAALRIAPDRVQLNTLDRPGTESRVRPADSGLLDGIAVMLQPLPVEIIARKIVKPDGRGVAGRQPAADLTARIVDTVRRRPCTAKDLAAGLDAAPAAVAQALRDLRARGILTVEHRARGMFYRAT